MESLKNRRSIRKYADRPVDDGLLHSLLEAAERTQTMGNLQLYSVVVTRSEEKKRELADQILEGEGLNGGSFTKEELMELLSGK